MTDCAETFVRWKHRATHWYGMFAGTSYYHQPQGTGRAFVPGQLKGYFNDLTGKTRWTGEKDGGGIPISKLSNGKTTHFPILICQKALGHWDLWLIERTAGHRQAFLEIAKWLVETQDSKGGWDTWSPLGQPTQYRYSAMTQGQALSVLVRANELAPDLQYETACGKAAELMQLRVQEGGVCWQEGGDFFLEEFPASERDTVLNGTLFAIFGLYDYLLRFESEQVSRFYRHCLDTLVHHLPGFDAGYWSLYSNATRRLASPFYHRLHLSQLEALKQVCPDPIIKEVQKRWSNYEQNRAYKALAVARKGFQKLREPAEITIVG